MTLAKLDESSEAYQMVKESSLTEEITQVGFRIEKRVSTCHGLVQLVEALNSDA
jgi:hypothetical protein